MSQRPLTLALLCLTLAATLAGCSGGGSSKGSSEESEKEGLPARVVPWGMSGCRFGVALVSAPAARVALHLPAGFRSLSLAEVGLGEAPNPTNDGNFGLEIFSCESGIGLDGEEIPGMVYASYFSAVEPPGALAEDVTYHFVKWDVLVPDEARRTLLLAYGIPAAGGSVEFSQAQDNGDGAMHVGAVNWDGRGAETFLGSSVTTQADGRFVEFTQTPGGLAAWRTNYTWLAGGLGPQLVVPAASGLAAQILGSTPHQAVGFSGRVDFTGGTITLPAQPAELPMASMTPTKPPRPATA